MSKDSLRNKKRVVKLVTIVTVMFSLSWLPIQLILLLKSLELYQVTIANISIQVINYSINITICRDSFSRLALMFSHTATLVSILFSMLSFPRHLERDFKSCFLARGQGVRWRRRSLCRGCTPAGFRRE